MRCLCDQLGHCCSYCEEYHDRRTWLKDFIERWLSSKPIPHVHTTRNGVTLPVIPAKMYDFTSERERRTPQGALVQPSSPLRSAVIIPLEKGTTK